MDLNKFQTGIEKTGFKLEYNTSQVLQESGWTVINNKYYIDDVKGGAREIDIVAYRARKTKECLVYTVLLISCKKSKDKIWALLSKEKIQNDPNTNWHPIHMWSNDQIIKYMLENQEWVKDYVTKDDDLYNHIFNPETHIFAFQEMHKENGTAQNDTAIFNSVTTLMKSQWYEKNSLDRRKKEIAAYNFNLISVVESDLINILFKNNKITTRAITDDKYIADYIIDKKETKAKIHFIKSESFPSIVDKYNKLHEHNIEQISSLYEGYFNNVLIDERRNVLIKEFNKELKLNVRFFLIRDADLDHKLDDLELSWNKEQNRVEIGVNVYGEPIEKLNSSKKIHRKTQKALKKIYRYCGDFVFANTIPF